MQTTQKAGDPSMEEILASIRKIIADDPVAPAPTALPPAPMGATLPAQAPSTARTSAGPGSGERKGPSALDQELADLLREPVALPGATPALSKPGLPASTISTAAAPPAPSLVQPAAAPSVDATDKATAAGLGGWLRNRSNSGVGIGANGALPTLDMPASTAPPAPASLATAPRSDGRSDPATVLIDAAAANRIKSAALGALASAANGSAAPVSVQSILNRLGVASAAPAPSLPTPGGASTRGFSGEYSPAGALVEQPASAPANRPVIDAPVSGLVAGPALANADVPVVVAPPPGIQMALPEPVSAAATQPPLEKPADTAIAPVAAAEAARVGVPSGEASADAVVAVPVQEAAAPAATAAEPGKSPAETSLDDTLAELLRPVVRQWLDENMARALEKAVRIEIADGVMSAVSKRGPGGKG